MDKTAAIIIIGNEILSGKVQDTNSPFLAIELRELGVDVRDISVIPDEVQIIARKVREASNSHDYVFTSGGVGPTHDDLTMLGVASGFGLKTEENPLIAKLIESRCGGREAAGAYFFKMAQIPQGAEVIQFKGTRFPTVVVKNVYVFPGIPQLLRQRFALIKDRFRSRPFHLRKVYLNEEECFVSEQLHQLDCKFPDVTIGSYPNVDEPEYKVVVTLESREEGSLLRAYDSLLAVLPESIIVKRKD